MSAVQFSAENLDRFQGIVQKYERPQSALLPVLYLAQEQFGYLTPSIMIYLAKLLEIPPRYVFEAVSFYTMFKTKDMGKYCVQVCNNITCAMMGSKKIIDTAQTELGLKVGEVSEDKSFSLITVECLGACDKAPVAQINETYVENLNDEKWKAVLGQYRESLRGGSV